MPLTYGQGNEPNGVVLYGFLRERLEFYLRDSLGFKYDVVNAVLAASSDRGDDSIADLIRRCELGKTFKTSLEFAPLVRSIQAHENIVRAGREAGIEPAARF